LGVDRVLLNTAKEHDEFEKQKNQVSYRERAFPDGSSDGSKSECDDLAC
jgi:hypothetical protein